MTVGASLPRRACCCLEEVLPSSPPSVLYTGSFAAPAAAGSLSIENSTVDSLNGPPEAVRAKYGALVADTLNDNTVGFVESSSMMALWSHIERMMDLNTMASRCNGISRSPAEKSISRSSGSYVVSSQVVVTPASDKVIVSGDPCLM